MLDTPSLYKISNALPIVCGREGIQVYYTVTLPILYVHMFVYII